MESFLGIKNSNYVDVVDNLFNRLQKDIEMGLLNYSSSNPKNRLIYRYWIDIDVKTQKDIWDNEDRMSKVVNWTIGKVNEELQKQSVFLHTGGDVEYNCFANLEGDDFFYSLTNESLCINIPLVATCEVFWK